MGRLPHRVAGIQREITINFLCDILNQFTVFFIFFHPNKCGEKRLEKIATLRLKKPRVIISK